MEKEEFEKIVLRNKEMKLSISRIPKKTKEEFVNLAREEFCEDYGMCLKYVWDNFKLFSQFLHNFDIKLNYSIELMEKIQIEEKPEKKVVKLLSGRKVEKEVEKK